MAGAIKNAVFCIDRHSSVCGGLCAKPDTRRLRVGELQEAMRAAESDST